MYLSCIVHLHEDGHMSGRLHVGVVQRVQITFIQLFAFFWFLYHFIQEK